MTGSRDATRASTSTTSARGSRARSRGRRRRRVSPSSPFSYAVVRIVPRVERGEQINAGVIVFCRPLGYLAARTHLDEPRLAALAPDLDAETVRPHLAAIERIAAGDADAGPIARLEVTQRFHWLVAPASTIVQPSEVHTGLCDDPDEQLDRLFRELVVT